MLGRWGGGRDGKGGTHTHTHTHTERERERERERENSLLLFDGCLLLSHQHLKDGSALTILRAAALI